MKNKNIQYYVEGENEKTLVNVLKTQLKMIKPGKVQKLNVIDEEITDAMLRLLREDTIVVLIFDTDTENTDILNNNIKKLNASKRVFKVITVPQVPNLESELIRSCKIKKITELLNSGSLSKFKKDFIRINNLGSKLLEHEFNISLLWSQKPPAPYQNIENNSKEIKLFENKK